MKIIIADLKMPKAIVYGYYDIDRNEININKKLKLRIKILVFIHEYIHFLINKLRLKRDYHFLLDFITILIHKKSKYKNINQSFKYYYGRRNKC